MADKKGFSLEGFEAPIGMLMRRWLKELLRTALKSFEQANPLYFAHMMWLMTSNDPEVKPIRDTLKGGIAGFAWLLELGVDMTKLPDWAKEPVEIFAGDLLGQISDQFELRKALYTFPADYVKPSREDVDKAFAELKSWLQKTISTAFKNLPNFLKFLSKGTLRGNLVRFMATLFSSEDDVVNAFLAFDNAELTDDEDCDAFVAMIENFDEPFEFVNFFRREPTQQKLLFEAAKKLRHHELWPRLWRKAQTNWPEFEKKVGEILDEVTASATAAKSELKKHTEERKSEVKLDLYSFENLERHPHLRHTMPRGAEFDVRRRMAEQKARGPFPWMLVILGAMFILVLMIGIGLSSGDGSPPDVYITFPNNGQLVADSSLTINGLAIDDHDVLKIEIQTDKFLPREPLVFLPGPRVSWTYPLHLHQGRNTFSIWVYDRSNKIASSAVTITYRPTVSQDSSAVPDTVKNVSAPRLISSAGRDTLQ